MRKTKHLAKGDELPELPNNTWRLYIMRFCPFAQRARLVMAHKQVPHETIQVNLQNKPNWFLERNPLGMVPVIEYNDKVVYESAITCEYLDKVFPEKKLFPDDPYQRARIMMRTEHHSKVVTLFFKMVKASGDEKQEIIKDMQSQLEKYEKELGDKKFFGGDVVNILDFFVWPWFERMDNIDTVLPSGKLPRLLQWTKNMREQPAVKEIAETLPTHKAFLEAHINGKPCPYDMEPIPG